MRISDWSSDVCSSDLGSAPSGFGRAGSVGAGAGVAAQRVERQVLGHVLGIERLREVGVSAEAGAPQDVGLARLGRGHPDGRRAQSEERRVGKEGGGTVSYSWSKCTYKKQKNKTK